MQFHPESVLTECGHLMLANWLAGAATRPRGTGRPGFAAEMDALRATAFAPA